MNLFESVRKFRRIPLVLAAVICFASVGIVRAQEETAGTPTAAVGSGDSDPPTAADTPPAEAPEGDKPAASAAAPAGESTESKPDENKPDEPPPEVPFSSQPYLVLASIAFDSGCLVDQSDRDAVVQDVRLALARMYGRLWQVTCEQNEWLIPGDVRHLQRLQAEELHDRYSERDVQKVFLVTIEGTSAEIQISCREYDTRIQELTPLHSEATLDARSIGSIASRLMRDTFRPSLLFLRSFPGENDRAMMNLQVQGGDIVPPDPSAEQILPGDVLRPFVREMERRDPFKLKRLKALPLTYIRVMEIDNEVTRGRVTGVYITHMRFQMFGAKGRNTQHLAVRQRPSAERSQVKLVLQTLPDKPLISHRLALAYQLNYKDEEDGNQTQLVSDRNGEVVIHSRENHPTFWIRVYSGSSLLARVPYAPGLLPSDTIELPDDSIRLGVEGELQLLADELVDAIALREVTMARARKTAEAGDTQQLDQLFTAYDAVHSKAYFLEQVTNVRVTAEKRAAEKRQGARSVVKLCKDFTDTVENFFTDQKRVERQAEIQQLRTLAAQKADTQR
ncbi:MAG: hypothetical protein R3C49_22465 [Planctomycetaceae bacterium]